MQKEASQAMSKETLLTVGIDLGTSTTQLVLSELTVENFASAFTVPRISISDKKVIYRSDIIFTPLLNQSEIDAEPIKAFVAEQYRQAGIHKQDIQMEIDIVDKSNCFFERDKPLGIVKTILSVQFVDKVMVNFTINTEQTSECFYVPDFLLVDKLEEICQKLNELL